MSDKVTESLFSEEAVVYSDGQGSFGIKIGNVYVLDNEGIWLSSEEENRLVAERIAACLNFCRKYETRELLSGDYEINPVDGGW